MKTENTNEEPNADNGYPLLSDVDRRDILLKAVLDILEKQKDSTYVLNFFEQTAFYDDAKCDGYCLYEDIKSYLEDGV